jgi:hypothetical protein
MPFAGEYYLVFVGIWINLLILALPVAAVISIRRRKRNRPGTTGIFQYLVLAGWVVFILLVIKWFLSGSWYGENGNDSLTVLVATIVLGTLVALYGTLYATSSIRKVE